MIEIHKKVQFKEEIYWLHGPLIEGHYNISPLDHYSDDGDLLADPFHDLSFAILWDGNIMQFGEIIGKKSDLIEIKETK